MIVYLSGPMTGKLNHNFPAFHAAAKDWRERGHEVINPAENFEGDVTLPRQVYMAADIGNLLRADTILMLQDWRQSAGACLELAVARELGHKVLDEDGVEQDWSVDLTPSELAKEQGEQRSVLEEAAFITEGARREYYGHPADNHGRTAKMWAAYLDTTVTARDVCNLNILQKTSRDRNKPVRDNAVDIAGYARNIEQIEEREDA